MFTPESGDVCEAGFGEVETRRPLMGEELDEVMDILEPLPKFPPNQRKITAQLRKVSAQFTPIAPTDENQERGNWSNPVEFCLSSLGYVVGLGNIWRFPYLVYRNGGGAFFISYFSMQAFSMFTVVDVYGGRYLRWPKLFLCGMPMVLMEFTLGQYWAQGSLTVWKIAPLFKGIGFSMTLLCFFCMVYYCVVTAWALYYLAVSLRAELPWACCHREWATPKCVSFVQDTPMCEGTGIPGVKAVNVWTNASKFASDEYFHRKVLGLSYSEGLHDIGQVQWPIVVALLVAWVIVFAVLIKGVKSMGKMSYVTSTLPYVVLITLLIKANMKEGAVEGLLFFFTPDFSRLATAQIWNDAATQIFYSNGVCFGCGITMASYNRRDHNVVRDAVFLSLADTFTSVLSGSVVFSILGFMAHSQNTTVAAVVTSGPGLTFIAYPQAVTLLSAAPVWSTLFFLLLSLLALSSMFPMVEAVITAIQDQYRHILQGYKMWVALGICIICAILGLSMTAEGGMFVLTLFDTYAVGKSLLFIGVVEVTVVGWRYGAGRLVRNLEAMTGRNRGLLYFRFLWTFVTPFLLVAAIVFSLIKETPAKYGDYTFPAWGVGVGWALTLFTVLPIPAYALYKLIHFKREGEGAKMTWGQALRELTLPSAADDEAQMAVIAKHSKKSFPPQPSA